MTREPTRVLVLSQNDYSRARGYASHVLADPEVRVVPVPPRPEEASDPIYRRLKGQLRPGALLIPNIWRPGEYVEATEAYEEMSLQKFLLVASVCQSLGATRMDVTEVQEIAEDGRQSGQAKLSLLTSRWQGSFSNETTEKVLRRLKAHWSWTGGRPNPGRAAKLARRSGLNADPVVMGLIDQRSDPDNRLLDHKLELDVSAEARREVKAAVAIQTLVKKLGPAFETDLTLLRKQSSRVQLSLAVTFG